MAGKVDAFEKLLGDVSSKYGENTLFSGQAAALADERIIFDAPRLTWAYGGGFKLNAIHRFNGKESGGKTTLCTYIAGQCQKRKYEKDGNYDNAHIIIIDNERTFDVLHAQDLGVLLEDPNTGKPLVHILRNKYVEDQCQAWETLVESGQVCATIYDSDAAGISRQEFDSALEKAQFGSSAKAAGTIIKRMNHYVDTYKTPVLWISQERANMDPMSYLPALTGGFAVNYYSSTRFRVTPKDQIMDKGELVGITMKIKNYKNKTGIPSRECLLNVYFKDGPSYSAGIDGNAQYFDMLTELGILNQHGAWFKFREGQPDEVKMQGMNGVKKWFAENPDEYKKVKDLVDSKMSGHDEILDAKTGIGDEKEEMMAEQKSKVQTKDVSALAEMALSDDNQSDEGGLLASTMDSED